MKKLLLLVAVAMTAVVASAQFAAQAEMAKVRANQFKVAESVPFLQHKMKRNVASELNTNRFAAVREAIANGTATPSKRVFKAPSQSSLYGTYIESTMDYWADVYNVGQPALSAYEYEGQTVVLIEGLLQGFADVLAVYDEATGTLDASGGQVCYEHEKYGEMLLLSMHEDDEEGLYGDVTFTVGEDGNITLDQYGLYVYMNEGEHEGKCWTAGLYTMLARPNGTAGGYFSSNSWKDTNDGPIYVEEMDDQVTIFNFDTAEGNGGAISLFLNEDGTGEVPNLQMVASGSSTTGDYFFQTAFADEERYLHEDPDESHSTPLIWGNLKNGDKIVYFGYETEEQIAEGQGMYTPAYNVVLSENGYWWNHWYNALRYQWTPASTDAITNVAKDVNPAMNKVYNLAGQQVRKDVKGIVISNGKKYLNK